jgi:hypothetical protein
MQDGRVGRELDMVVIYPQENAGTRHGNPKKIGLGIDIQFERGTLGVAYPGLGLVEMHMPTQPTHEELEGYNNAQWTLAHEVAGHFTDLNEENNNLTLVARINGRSYYTANNRFEHSAQADFDRVTNEERGLDTRNRFQRVILRRPFNRHLTWRIRRGTQMVNGTVERREETVNTDDPRLTEAVFVRNQRFINDYARTNADEHYAEAAAQIATGTGVPFREEMDTRFHQVQPRAGYADTYAASTTMHSHITGRWGSDENADNLHFPDVAPRNWSDSYTRLEDDPEMVQLANTARNQPMPEEDELLNIITGRRI